MTTISSFSVWQRSWPFCMTFHLLWQRQDLHLVRSNQMILCGQIFWADSDMCHLCLARHDEYLPQLWLFVDCQDCSKNVTYISWSNFGKTMYVTMVHFSPSVWWCHKIWQGHSMVSLCKIYMQIFKNKLCLLHNISHSPKVVIC